ncbi:MAG TPA: TIGR03435 family protein [Bryobacteraceae bacterium]|nr:TIGR03435 family protein [Bryobacteraceae bacterium]
MRFVTVSLCFIGLACSTVFGQSFEVASVKPHAPSGDNRIRVIMGGGPGTPDPGRINYENVTVMNVLTQAFNVRDYQISGPSWIDSERFDITAKVPQGASKEEFRAMLRNLLKERFGMAFHMDNKELPAYALVVAKGGPKLTKAAETPEDPQNPNAPPPPPSGKMTDGPKDKYGFPAPPPGRGGNMMMMMPGKAKMVSNNTTIARFTEMLANQLGRPVVDKTELTGKYDITLYFEPEMMRGRGGMAMPPSGMTPEGGGAGPMPPPADGESAPTLVTALQEQLGLKLESRKESVDFVVIDKLDKTVTDN